ncbi:phosphatase PAP2 family protein [Chitinimonas sp.]|uniref:phosphatase PAP2 family protein n=1 Tax=Chitinimonas sp. TaxID=1934313 RepID=UPI0035B4F0C7
MMLKTIVYDWGGLNVWLFRHIHPDAATAFDTIMLLGSVIGNYWNFPIVLVLAGVGRHLRHDALPRLRMWAVGFLMLSVAVTALKIGTAMPRPSVALAGVQVLGGLDSPYGFPSGHAAFAMWVAATLWPYAGRRSRAVLGLTAFWVGLSRIWLGAHFPADVLAGYLTGYGAAWLARQTTLPRQRRWFSRET